MRRNSHILIPGLSGPLESLGPLELLVRHGWHCLHATPVLFVFWVVVWACPEPCRAQNNSEKITFDNHIQPILQRRCSSCHNNDRTESGLNVTNFIDLMQGGGSGDVVEPFAAEGSFLMGVVTHADSPEMPPSGDKIPAHEIELLKRWIDQGALENALSTAKPNKPRLDLGIDVQSVNEPPDPLPQLPRMSLQPQLHTARKSPIRSIATNPWLPIAAIASPRQVLLYDCQRMELRGVIPFPDGHPDHLCFSRNGGLLLIAGGVGGASGRVHLWDVNHGRSLIAIGNERDSVLAADISPDHKWVALGGPQKTVRVYAVADGTLQYELKSHTQWITAIEFSPDGQQLLTADRNGGLILWDAVSGNKNFDLIAHKQGVTAVAWRSDGKVLASASEDKTVRIWSPQNGSQVKSFEADGSGVADVVFTSDGRILTTGREKKVKRWKQNGAADGQFEGLTDVGMSVAWCATTERIVAGDWHGEVLVWDVGDPQPVGGMDSNPPLIADRIAAVSEDLTMARDRFNSAEKSLDAKIEKLQLLQQESANKTDELIQLADATGEEALLAAQIAGQLAAIAEEIGRVNDEIEPMRKIHDAAQEEFEKFDQIVSRWQSESDFAASKNLASAARAADRPVTKWDPPKSSKSSKSSTPAVPPTR